MLSIVDMITLAVLRGRAVHWVWDEDIRSLRGGRRFLVGALRMGHALIRAMIDGQITLHAMSLVYTTLLSLVPLMAVSFSVLKSFGVHHQALPLLTQFLAPLGTGQSEEAARRIVVLVESIDVGLLGAIGLGTLIYTGLSLLHKIEMSINSVWSVSAPRRLGKRVTNYLSVIVVGPLLIGVAMGVTAYVLNEATTRGLLEIQPFGALALWGTRLFPYLLVWAAFSFIYAFVPNVPVTFRAATVGGLVAGALWQTTGILFGTFIATSANYARIYSSLSILILGLIWLYTSWLILLVGAQIAYFIQNPRRYLLHPPVPIVLSNRLRERIALSTMLLIGRNHHENRPAWTIAALADRLDLPPQIVQKTVELLHAERWISQTADDPGGWLPARDIGTIGLSELIRSIRRAGERGLPPRAAEPIPPAVDRVMESSREGADAALGDMTLADLVREARDAGDRTR